MKVKIGTSGNLFWALCKIIGEEWDKGKELVENAEKDDDGYIFDIELKIDGVEFNFDSIITGLLQRQNEEIKRQVQYELEDKFYDIINKAQDIVDDLDEISDELKN